MSIIFRYLTAEIFKSMLAIGLVVLVITLGFRFGGYLTKAAEGLLMRDVLLQIMLLRLPGMIELVLPLSFFIGIVTAFSRIQADSEMLVLRACGVGPGRILLMTSSLALAVTLFAALTSLWLKPEGEARLFRLLSDQRSITEFDTLVPGRFQRAQTGRRVTYVEDLNREEGRLTGVFFAERQPGREYIMPPDQDLVIAASGSQQVDAKTGDRFLVLRDGHRYSGNPGSADYQVISYREYGQLIGRAVNRPLKSRSQIIPTRDLLRETSPVHQAELQWRISMVLMVPLVALLALALTQTGIQTNPRQGGVVRLLPGVAICFLYVVFLSSARAAVAKSQMAPFPGVYSVHLLMLVILACLYAARQLLGRQKAQASQAAETREYSPE